jgi:hypothetical protein
MEQRQAGGGGCTPSKRWVCVGNLIFINCLEQNSSFVPGFVLFSAALKIFWNLFESVPFSGTAVLLRFLYSYRNLEYLQLSLNRQAVQDPVRPRPKVLSFKEASVKVRFSRSPRQASSNQPLPGFCKVSYKTRSGVR